MLGTFEGGEADDRFVYIEPLHYRLKAFQMRGLQMRLEGREYVVRDGDVMDWARCLNELSP